MHRLIPVFAVALALMFGSSAFAEDTAATTVPLKVTLMQEAAAFEVPYYDAFLTVGENKFTFLVPQGFRLKGDPAKGRIMLGNQDGDCSITFTILSAAPTDPSSLSADACRAFLMKKHPGGNILQESSASVIGRNGPAFDIQWRTAENIYECERIAFIPTPHGTFLFTSASGRNAFPQAQANLGLVMATFRASTDGKFNPVHIQTVN